MVSEGKPVVDPTSNPFVEINSAAIKLHKRKEKDLQKYINKKLKKDERSSLLDRLQNATVNRDSLQSSRFLGVGQNLKEKPSRSMIICEENNKTENQADTSDSESDIENKKSNFLLKSAEIIEKDPFKATKELLCPTFLESSSEESSSDDDDDENFETGEPSGITQVSFMAAVEPIFNVPVERDPLIQEQRSQLPIFAEEQSIMEAIKGNPVVIICGETGSGKTTQVPQFLYEAGYGNRSSSNPGLIAVTQPRRVAAVSMADRIGNELNDKALVAYQIRYDSSTVTPKSVIKFMTDGILLREIQSDFLLSRYSIILLDEAHERNLNTDILVGLLSRIVKLRWKKSIENPKLFRPLRLVIMSATLNVEEFAKPSLFNPLPPVLRVEARQHPVTVHFNRKTNDDYLEEALKTVSKIHANLPDGGILVFLSGKREILSLVKSLREKFPAKTNETNFSEKSKDGSIYGDIYADGEADLASDLENDLEESSTEQEKNIFNSCKSSDEDEEDGRGFTLGAKTKQPLHVLPLYSLMSPEEQMRIFSEPPVGTRICIIATNVAETSITIKNIRYVVDCGKVKQRIWDSEGRQRYEIVWTSKASVAQRTGRAGRTGPGHCYRLFSSAVFDNDFPAHTPPEIARMPMEGLVLQLKNMTIDNVERFPLPTQPEQAAVIRAQNHLVDLGILDKESLVITDFGKSVALFPLTPSWGSLLVHAINLARSQSSALKFVPITIAFVSAMTIGDPFNDFSNNDNNEATSLNPSESSEPFKSIDWKLFCGKPVSSDLFTSLGALLAFIKQSSSNNRSQFCKRHHLIEKRLEEMFQQLNQLLRMCSQQLPELSIRAKDLNETISMEEKFFLRRLMSQAFPFQIAEKVSIVLPLNDPNRKLASKLSTYRVLGASSQSSLRFLHPSSLLAKIPPKYLVFTESLSVKDRKSGSLRHYIKNVTAIEPSWIPSQTLSRTM